MSQTEAFEKLLAAFSLKKSYSEQISLFRELCTTAIESLSLKEVEEKFFRRVMPITLKLLDIAIEDLCKNISVQDEAASDGCLESVGSITDGVLELVRFVKTSENLLMEHVYSFLNPSLHILNRIHNHVKESENIYGALFQRFENVLGTIVNKTLQLQVNLLQSIEKIEVNGYFESDVSHLVDVCHSLLSLVKVVEYLDAKVQLYIWRVFANLTNRYCGILRDRLDTDDCVAELCSKVVEWLKGFQHAQTEEDEFLQELKIATLYLKIIVSIIEKYKGYLGECVLNVVDLIVHLNNLSASVLFYPSLNKKQQDEICRTLLIAVEPMVVHLFEEKCFLESILKHGLKNSEYFGICILLTLILDKAVNSDDVLNLLMEDSGAHETVRLKNLFEWLDKCNEVFMPIYLQSVSCHGHTPRKVCLYEFVCVHVCGFVAALPSRHFSAIEGLLLHNLISGSTIRALLASDVWCFLSRFGSPYLCYTHVQLLGRLAMLSIPHSSTGLFVYNLFKRLSNFLADDHKLQLQNWFRSNNAEDMACLLHSSESGKQNVVEPETCLRNIIGSRFTPKTLIQMLHVLDCLNNHKYKDVLQRNLVSSIIKLMNALPVKPSNLGCVLLSKLIYLCTKFLHSFDKSHIFQVLRIFHSLVSSSNSDFRLVSAVLTISKLSLVKFSEPADRREFVRQTSQLFCLALNSRNYIVQQLSLQAFTDFARSTLYDEVISNSLRSSDLKQLVSSYLQKEESKRMFDWFNYVKCQQSSVNCVDKGEFSEVSAKKLKLEVQDEEVRQTIEKLKLDITTLQQFPGESLTPFKNELVSIKIILEKILETV